MVKRGFAVINTSQQALLESKKKQKYFSLFVCRYKKKILPLPNNYLISNTHFLILILIRHAEKCFYQSVLMFESQLCATSDITLLLSL